MQALLQFALLFGLICLPGIMLAALVRLPSIYSFVQRSHAHRTAVVLGNGLLCFFVTCLVLAWFAAWLSYGLAEFYFGTTFGLVPGITRADVEQFRWIAITEMWLRSVTFRGLACISRNAIACQLASAAGQIGSFADAWPISLLFALVATLVNLWLGWWLTRPRARPAAR